MKISNSTQGNEIHNCFQFEHQEYFLQIGHVCQTQLSGLDAAVAAATAAAHTW